MGHRSRMRKTGHTAPQLSSAEESRRNLELKAMFEKALTTDPYRVYCVDGPLEGREIDTDKFQEVFTVAWPPKALDPEGNEKKQLFTYRICSADLKRKKLYFKVSDKAEQPGEQPASLGVL